MQSQLATAKSSEKLFFELLPEEIIQHIFLYLDEGSMYQAQFVSTKFFRISKELLERSLLLPMNFMNLANKLQEECMLKIDGYKKNRLEEMGKTRELLKNNLSQLFLEITGRSKNFFPTLVTIEKKLNTSKLTAINQEMLGKLKNILMKTARNKFAKKEGASYKKRYIEYLLNELEQHEPNQLTSSLKLVDEFINSMVQEYPSKNENIAALKQRLNILKENALKIRAEQERHNTFGYELSVF